jgi:hypothetical protein
VSLVFLFSFGCPNLLTFIAALTIDAEQVLKVDKALHQPLSLPWL